MQNGQSDVQKYNIQTVLPTTLLRKNLDLTASEIAYATNIEL